MAAISSIPPDSGSTFTTAELASFGLLGDIVTTDTGVKALVVVPIETEVSKAPKVEPTYVIDMTSLGVAAVAIDGVKLKGGIELTATTQSDSLTFGAEENNKLNKTEIKGGTIDLGGGADTFTINKSAVLKKVTVTNFSADDTVVTKKGTFTVEDLNAKGKLKGAGLGGVTFQVTPPQ